MADRITVYQCPACTGPLQYDGKIDKLKCEYCGSTFTIQEVEALYKEKNAKAEAAAAAECGRGFRRECRFLRCGFRIGCVFGWRRFRDEHFRYGCFRSGRGYSC